MACINVDGGPTEIEMMTPAAFAAATASAAEDGPNGNSSRFEYVILIVLLLFLSITNSRLWVLLRNCLVPTACT